MWREGERQITVTWVKEWQIVRAHTHTRVEGRGETSQWHGQRSDKSYTHTRVKGTWDYRQITVVWEKVTNHTHTHVSRECETTDRSQWYEKKSDKSYTHTHVKGMWDYRQITAIHRKWERLITVIQAKELQIMHAHKHVKGSGETDHSNTGKGVTNHAHKCMSREVERQSQWYRGKGRNRSNWRAKEWQIMQPMTPSAQSVTMVTKRARVEKHWGKHLLTSNGKEITFVSVLHHMGMRGNLAADSAAKGALDADRWTHPLLKSQNTS